MKKVLSLLLMLTCVLSLTACGGEKKTFRYDEEMIKAACGFVLVNITGPEFTEQDFEDFDYYTVDQLQTVSDSFYQVSSGAVMIDGKVFIDGVNSWYGSKGEIGTPNLQSEQYTFDKKDDELIVSYAIPGSSHNATMEFIFDKNLHITSVTTNVTYSFRECMEKAGINTAVGMGTVFAMLIIIMIIIYILGAVCGPKKSAAKKEEVVVEETVDKAIEAIVEREEDDTELIAVIAAAIAASEGASSTDGFVVRSIRKIR